MTRTAAIFWLAAIVLVFGTALALAQSPDGKPADKNPASKAAGKAPETKAAPRKPGAKILPFTPEREAAALSFVKNHHPELGDVLGSLRSMDRQAYETAVGELFQRSELIADLSLRDPSLAALALSDWKAQSRIELLVARQRQQPTEANATEVRKLLVEQSDLRIKRKEIERDRAQAALARAETQLSKLKAEQSQWVEQQAKRLLRGLAKPKAGAKAETKARGDSK